VSTSGADGVAGNSDDDCDDTDIAIYPGAAEICDGSDNNCDGSSDENLVGVDSLCPAQSCIDLLDTWQVNADGVYWVDPAGAGAFQVYCDMNIDGGGWTLLAKFAASGSSWRWGQGEWLSGAALAAASSLDPTTVADAKNEAWGQLTVAELRMDAVGSNSSNGPYVLFNNTATQTMAALMNASGSTLTTTAGSITSFSAIDPGFQGDAGAAGATLQTHLTSSHSLSGDCCDLTNRVTLGSTHAASFSSGIHGAANAGFTGVGGTIRYRDGHFSSCCNYGLQGENDRNTSGNDIVLWGR